MAANESVNARVVWVYYLRSIKNPEWRRVTLEEYLEAERSVGLEPKGKKPFCRGFTIDGIQGATGHRYFHKDGTYVDYILA